ncbi:MAG: flagellar basal body P-ring protein FlgI [Bacteriovoracaceae bacterium]
MKNALIILCALLPFQSMAMSRLKDIVTIKGARENALIGYGLVIGLNGTGDSGGEVTNSSLKKMFQKLGLNPQKEVTSKNVAAVIVTAKLPPFARQGQKIDLTVSSVGDAGSLAGGTLMVTPLKAGDNNVYAIGSGPISVGGLTKGAKFATTAKIPTGGIVEKENELSFNEKQAIRLNLTNPDFTTAARIEKTINQELGGKYASAKDSSTVDLILPPAYHSRVVELIAIVENFQVNTDNAAKIVINERTGTVVAGGDVILKNVAVSHGDLVIEVKSGTGPGKQAVHMLEEGASLNDLVKALNAIGTGPEDLISIFQALKQNGALIGELEFL